MATKNPSVSTRKTNKTRKAAVKRTVSEPTSPLTGRSDLIFPAADLITPPPADPVVTPSPEDIIRDLEARLAAAQAQIAAATPPPVEVQVEEVTPPVTPVTPPPAEVPTEPTVVAATMDQIITDLTVHLAEIHAEATARAVPVTPPPAAPVTPPPAAPSFTERLRGVGVDLRIRISNLKSAIWGKLLDAVHIVLTPYRLLSKRRWLGQVVFGMAVAVVTASGMFWLHSRTDTRTIAVADCDKAIEKAADVAVAKAVDPVRLPWAEVSHLAIIKMDNLVHEVVIELEGDVETIHKSVVQLRGHVDNGVGVWAEQWPHGQVDIHLEVDRERYKSVMLARGQLLRQLANNNSINNDGTKFVRVKGTRDGIKSPAPSSTPSAKPLPLPMPAPVEKNMLVAWWESLGS